MNKKLSVWVVAAKFPNIVQPWLANSTAQILVQGHELEVFSMEKGDLEYADIVDHYNLKKKTVNIHFQGKSILIAAIKNFLNPFMLTKSIAGLLELPQKLSPHKSLISNLLSAIALAPYCKKSNVDVIHSHFEITGHKFLPVIRSQDCAFVVTFHGLPPPGVPLLPSKMRQEYVEAADIILVNTQFAKKQYLSLGADEKKIRILPQGIETSSFEFNKKTMPTDGPVNLLTVGRFHSDKGHIFVLNALPKLISQGYKIHYTMVGAGPDRKKLEREAMDLGVKEHVTFHTAVSEQELKSIYEKSHIFILPSLRDQSGFHEETQGVVIQEAQATGLIVIATRTGGIPECVEDGKSAFLVEDRNALEISEKIKFVIDNPELWHQWQIEGRKHVETHFDINLIGKKISAIYQEAIELHNISRLKIKAADLQT